MDFQFCPSCEQLNEPEAKRCGQCGADLSAHAASPPAPPLATAAHAVPSASVAHAVPSASAPAAPAAATAPAPAAPPARARELEEAIGKNPKARALYLQLAQVYEGAGQLDQARATLERYLQVDPANAWVRQRLHALGHAPAAPAFASRTATLPRPVPPRPFWQRPPIIAAAVLLLAIAAVGVKMLVFPSTRLLVGGNEDAQRPRWSPKGDRIAFVAARQGGGALAVYSFKDAKARDLAPQVDGGAFAWSPDGRQVAYVSSVEEEGLYGEAVYVADVDGDKPRRLAMGDDPSWSPDGVFVAMTCSGEEAMAAARAAYEAAVTYDESGEPVTLMQPPPLPAEASPGLCLVNAVTGDVQRLPAGGGPVAFSPDGARLAFTMDTDEPAPSAPASASGADTPAAFDDGSADPTELTNAVTFQQPRNLAQSTAVLNRELEARMYDEKKKRAAEGAGGLLWAAPGDVFLMGIDGSGLARLTTVGRAAAPAWSRDGSRILYVVAAERGAEVWSIAPGGGTPEQQFTVPVEGWDPSAVALSADGKRVVFPSRVQANEGMARLMTGESPLDLHLLEAGAKAPRRLENKHLFKQRFALSPDGRRVVYEYRNDKTGKSELWLLRL